MRESITTLDEAIGRLPVVGRVRGATVWYTAVFGGYDRLHEPEEVPDDVDLVCFTDDPSLRSSRWTVVFVDFLYRDPRRTARLFKCLPHLLFPSHSRSLWVDANFRIGIGLGRFLCDYDDSFWVCFEHPVRNCAYAEARYCLRTSRDDAELLQRQLGALAEEGMPHSYGLVATGVLWREHGEPLVREVSQDWVREVDRYSARDQVSFPLVAWRRQFRYRTFSASLGASPGLHYVPHLKWRFYGAGGLPLRTLRSFGIGIYYRVRVGLNGWLRGRFRRAP